MKTAFFASDGRPRSGVRKLALASVLVGTSLLAVNVTGFFVPMRAAEIDGYVDFAGTSTTTASDTLARLAAMPADASDFQLASRATRIIHDGIAHIAPAEVEANGFAHYGMRVPMTENWVLYLLSYLKPDTYSDYEFCSYWPD